MNTKPTEDTPCLGQIAEQPDLLVRLNVKQLRALWTHHFSKKPAPLSPALLRHEMAYAAQAKLHGDLNSENRILIRQAMRFVESANEHKEEGQDKLKPQRSAQKRLSGLPSAELNSGTLLIRKWQGIEHKVTFQNKQFIYQGKHYRSLTKIAEVITGTHWSGPRFFGLTTLRQ